MLNEAMIDQKHVGGTGSMPAAKYIARSLCMHHLLLARCTQLDWFSQCHIALRRGDSPEKLLETLRVSMWMAHMYDSL